MTPVRNETQRHNAVFRSAGKSPICLLPLYSANGLRRQVAADAADVRNFGGNACSDALQQHLAFFGGFSRFVEELPRIKARCVEKKLFVEADAKRAITLARASAGGHGVDGIQLDKVPVSELAELVRRIRDIDPRITIIAAGGINPQNAGAYVACGVDGLATTAPFTAKPVDMSVRMRPLE